MTSRNAWLKVFPINEAARAVSFLQQVWHELASAKLSSFHVETKEQDLTFVLAERLKDTAQSRARLTGRWGQESLGGTIDKSGRITRRWRTDIEYFSNRSEVRLSLIFEFKKLDELETSRKQYCTQGMARFVTGEYSKGEPVALMVGILMADASACQINLRQGLELPESVAALRMQKFGGGGLFCIPSKLFPPVAAFDTEHSRAKDKAASHGSICISHLFLSFPEGELRSRNRHIGRKRSKRPRGVP